VFHCTKFLTSAHMREKTLTQAITLVMPNLCASNFLNSIECFKDITVLQGYLTRRTEYKIEKYD